MKGITKIYKWLLAFAMTVSLCGVWAFGEEDKSYSWTSSSTDSSNTSSEVTESTSTSTDDDDSPVSNTTITIDGDGTFTLTNNLTADIVIKYDHTVTIDLAGYTLTGTGTSSVISSVYDESKTTGNITLTLTDSSSNGTGVITGGNAESGGAINLGQSTFTMSGGTIKSCSATNGGAIYLREVAFTMTGGTIDSCTAKKGGAIYGIYEEADKNAELTIDGGTITNCSSTSGGYAGGIYITNTSTLNIKSGTISNCNDYGNYKGGGAIRAGSGCTVNISGGTITGNSSNKNGGAIYADGSTINITGGEISSNSASIGGGIYACVQTGSQNSTGEATINITGGTLANNTANTEAADLYSASSCVLNISSAYPSESYPCAKYYTYDSSGNVATSYTIVGWYNDTSSSRYFYDSTNNKASTNEVTSFESTNSYSLIAAHDATTTVTYTDGVDDEVIFADTSYTDSIGALAIAAGITPTRDDYTFTGWDPTTIASDTTTITAQWEHNHSYVYTGDDAITWTWTANASDDSTDAYTVTATVKCENYDEDQATLTYSSADGDITVSSENAAATCEKDAYVTYTATFTVDGETYTDTKVDTTSDSATGHDYDYSDLTWEWADDYSSATATATCKNDSSHTTTLGATVSSSTTKAATCTEKGSATYTATVTVSGTDYTDTQTVELDMIDHSYTSEVTTEATCTEDGTITYTCSVCGDTYTETITASHSYVGEVTTAATCISTGVMTYTCSVCGDTYTEEIAIDPDAHDLTKVEYSAPTFEEEGNIEYYVCSLCGKYFTADTDTNGNLTGTFTEVDDVTIDKLTLVVDEESEDTVMLNVETGVIEYNLSTTVLSSTDKVTLSIKLSSDGSNYLSGATVSDYDESVIEEAYVDEDGNLVIVPAEGLVSQTYTTTVTVTLEDGTTQEIEISFVYYDDSVESTGESTGDTTVDDSNVGADVLVDDGDDEETATTETTATSNEESADTDTSDNTVMYIYALVGLTAACGAYYVTKKREEL